MTNKYLFDTNIFIYYFNNDEKVLQLFFDDFITQNQVFYSFISEIELLSFPKLNSTQNEKIRNFLSAFNEILIDSAIISKVIELKRKYSIKLGDSIIAATALELNAILVTRNEKDFNTISKIKILNPFK